MSHDLWSARRTGLTGLATRVEEARPRRHDHVARGVASRRPGCTSRATRRRDVARTFGREYNACTVKSWSSVHASGTSRVCGVRQHVLGVNEVLSAALTPAAVVARKRRRSFARARHHSSWPRGARRPA